MVALGGNAISPAAGDGTFDAQMAVVEETAAQLVDVLQSGYRVVLTHGNGPQVGALLLQQAQGEPPAQPLDVCGAMSQGQVGYMLVQALSRQFEERGLTSQVSCLLTRTLIDPDDPALDDPSKPIGPFVDEQRAEDLLADGQAVERVRTTGGRDYRRVVPSPEPTGILELGTVERLVEWNRLVVCGGGGGVPVARVEGELTGYEAVVDKDRLTQVLGDALDASVLLVLTDVDGVYLDYGTADERRLDRVTVGEIRAHLEAGEFPDGSMGPKVEAACRFVEADAERRAIVAGVDEAATALAGEAGTHVVADE
jgi:carbamate kinase